MMFMLFISGLSMNRQRLPSARRASSISAGDESVMPLISACLEPLTDRPASRHLRSSVPRL